jgi:hypothetical protein
MTGGATSSYPPSRYVLLSSSQARPYISCTRHPRLTPHAPALCPRSAPATRPLGPQLLTFSTIAAISFPLLYPLIVFSFLLQTTMATARKFVFPALDSPSRGYKSRPRTSVSRFLAVQLAPCSPTSLSRELAAVLCSSPETVCRRSQSTPSESRSQERCPNDLSSPNTSPHLLVPARSPSPWCRRRPPSPEPLLPPRRRRAARREVRVLLGVSSPQFMDPSREAVDPQLAVVPA